MNDTSTRQSVVSIDPICRHGLQDLNPEDSRDLAQRARVVSGTHAPLATLADATGDVGGDLDPCTAFRIAVGRRGWAHRGLQWRRRRSAGSSGSGGGAHNRRQRRRQRRSRQARCRRRRRCRRGHRSPSRPPSRCLVSRRRAAGAAAGPGQRDGVGAQRVGRARGRADGPRCDPGACGCRPFVSPNRPHFCFALLAAGANKLRANSHRSNNASQTTNTNRHAAKKRSPSTRRCSCSGPRCSPAAASAARAAPRRSAAT